MESSIRVQILDKAFCLSYGAIAFEKNLNPSL